MHGAKARILDGAIRQVAAHGWNVPIAQIAAAANCNDLTVYRNFGDKENLLRQVMLEASKRNPIPRYMSDVLQATKVPVLENVMCGLVEIVLRKEHRDLWRMIYYAAMQRPDILKLWDQARGDQDTHSMLETYVRRLQSQGEITCGIGPAEAARKLHSLLLGSFTRNVLMADIRNSDPDPIEAMRTLCRLLQRVP